MAHVCCPCVTAAHERASAEWAGYVAKVEAREEKLRDAVDRLIDAVQASPVIGVDMPRPAAEAYRALLAVWAENMNKEAADGR